MTLVDTHPDALQSWSRDEDWQQRLTTDAVATDRFLPTRLRAVHASIVARAHDLYACGLILSGSTARGRRTEISDLDYHLIGAPIDVEDLSHELDLHVLSARKLEAQILSGDDFVQWSLRFGRIVFDDGTIRAAIRLIAERRLWPDVERKCEHASKSLDLAERVIASGDEDAALLQVRTALSLAARAFLLSIRAFPLTRAELPGQLEGAGRTGPAKALAETIDGIPGLEELAVGVSHGRGLIEETAGGLSGL